MDLSVIVGGQFGSEAKGHVTAQVIRRSIANDQPVVNIRVAGPNAGHSARDDNDNMHAFRTIPIGLVSANPLVKGHIAAGSEIDMDVLRAELRRMNEYGLPIRLTIDPEVTLLEAQHKQTEAVKDLVERIGSTGKGIGAARADRLLRGARRLGDAPDLVAELQAAGVGVEELNLGDLKGNTHVVIEGTQGFGLGLHTGFYPQCTSSDTRAIDFLAMAGISPWDPAFKYGKFHVWVVLRPFPIRVAGNSGPLLGETTWDELGLPEERTTVTKKVRRVGAWDPILAWEAVRANGGAPVVRVALTMLDQVIPELEGISSKRELTNYFDKQTNLDLFITFSEWTERVLDTGAPLAMVTTSDDTAVWL